MGCWVVDAMFPPSIFEDRCVDLQRLMIDLSTFENRCEIDDEMYRVDLRESMIDMSPFEDG